MLQSMTFTLFFQKKFSPENNQIHSSSYSILFIINLMARHTRALSGELAIDEFQRSWGQLELLYKRINQFDGYLLIHINECGSFGVST